jgi:hypothetical protein
LFYNTTSGTLKVYTGSAWEQGVTAGSGFLPLTGGQLTGNLTFSGTETVDGRDLSVDGAKLDGIEAGATADQTKVDIDALNIAASTAATLATARNIAVTGAVTGNANFDGSGNISISTTATSDPTLTLSGDASGSATFTNLGNATLSVTVADDSHNHVISNVDGLQTALDAKLASSSYTASDVLTKIKTVDGSGSGLDADLLDGFNSSQTESANTVAVRSSAGYLFSNYFNGTGTFATSANNSGMGRFTGTNGSDTYGRSYTAAAARALLNVADGANNITNNNQLSNGAGYATTSYVNTAVASAGGGTAFSAF